MKRDKIRIDLSSVPAKSLVEFDACTRCGECSIICPTGGEAEQVEERTPRGKIRAVRKVVRTLRNPLRAALTSEKKMERMLSDLSESVYQCSICGMCMEACPLSLRTIEMWESLRRSLVDSGLGPKEPHEALVKSIENYDNPWMQPRTQRARWAKKIKSIVDATKEKIDILYYVGCTASYDPEINRVAQNLASIAEKAGLRMGILGKAEKCCGSTLLRIGEYERARKLALENVDIFRRTDADRIVTACAGCYKTLAQDYPSLTGARLPVFHTTQLLAELLSEDRLPLKKDPPGLAVTYHDPCHLGRHTQMYDWPREIISRLPGVTLVEMERNRERSRCCGAGGGLMTLNQELVFRIAGMRIEDAERTGTRVLVTSCPFCQQTLVEAARRRDNSVKVIDITDLVIELLE